MFNMFSSEPRDLKARELCAVRLARPVPGSASGGWCCIPMCSPARLMRPTAPRLSPQIAISSAPFSPNAKEPALESPSKIFLIPAGRHGGRQCCRFFGAVPDELCELIDTLNHPLIGACWDTGHARMMHHDQKACLTAIGSRLKALHIQENDGRNDDHMLPFASGGDGAPLERP